MPKARNVLLVGVDESIRWCSVIRLERNEILLFVSTADLPKPSPKCKQNFSDTSRTFLVSAYHVESLFFSSSCVTRNLITKDFCNPVYCTHLESTHYYYRDLLSLVHFGLATVFAGCSCLGWMAAEVLPISLAENQNQASLNTYWTSDRKALYWGAFYSGRRFIFLSSFCFSATWTFRMNAHPWCTPFLFQVFQSGLHFSATQN